MIYLDHAATTQMCEAAKQAIINHLDKFGNPSSSYELGRQSRILIEDARERIAYCISAEPSEIFFTSGGSEANTWATNNRATISSSIEHHSLNAISNKIYVDQQGLINPQLPGLTLHHHKQVFELVSCMLVNNELGVIQPVKEIAQTVHSMGKLFHTDAVQAVGHMPIDVKDLGCDMLSASSHKFFGPKGVGFLFVKDGIDVKPLIYGGKQELGKRGGTENTLGVIAMAAALEDAVEHMIERNEYVRFLRDNMLYPLLQIPGSHMNGSFENRVGSNINIRFDGVSGAQLVTLCDSLYNICISAGSACNEGQAQPSHVLKAIGLTDDEALSSIRITIGHTNTLEEINDAAFVIKYLVERIRNEE